jgi:O-antigen/teichoic acid export membrane protein
LIAHYLIAISNISNVRDNLSLEKSNQLFQFGGWMTLSNIISPLMVFAYCFLIENVLCAAVVAYYTIPADFMIRLLVLPAAITTTLFPVFSKDISEKITPIPMRFIRKVC